MSSPDDRLPASPADEGGEAACWAHLLAELDLAVPEPADPEPPGRDAVADDPATSSDMP